jgi:hypothetical protein
VPSTGPVVQGYFTKKIAGARRLAKRAPELDVYAAERRLRAAGINTRQFTERRMSDTNEGDLDEYVASLFAAEDQLRPQEPEENMIVENFGDSQNGINQSSMLDSRPASSAASGHLDMLEGINSADALTELHASKRYNVKLNEKGNKLVKPFDKVKKGGSNELSANDYESGYRSDDGYAITASLRDGTAPMDVVEALVAERALLDKGSKKVTNPKIKTVAKSKKKLIYKGEVKKYPYKKTLVGIRHDYTEDKVLHPRLIVADSDLSTFDLGETLNSIEGESELEQKWFMDGLRGREVKIDDFKNNDAYKACYKLGIEFRAVAMFSDAKEKTGAGLMAGYLITQATDFKKAKKLFLNSDFNSLAGGLPSQNTGITGTAMFELTQALVDNEEGVSFSKKQGTIARPKIDKAKSWDQAGGGILTISESEIPEKK